ncbi:hypothetical protein MMC30_004062 [Trapelia coarctata]|nr:hypothetical protein [Trapelia coarctata]
MADEFDNVDISLLKALVLAFEPEVSFVTRTPAATRPVCRDRICTALTPPSLQSPEAFVASSPASKRRKIEIVSAEKIESERVNRTSGRNLPQHKPATTGRKAARFSASQPELPSTIPDSFRAQKMSHGSQRSGDTQPLSQWVYDAYHEDGKSPVPHKPAAEGNVNTQGRDHPYTNSETQTGRVDLVGIYDQASTRRDFELEDQNVDDLGELSQLDVHAELFPEASRFKQPKTPATNGKKRNGDSALVHQEPVTPSLPINPFANNAGADVGVMGLSQVFRTTQAPSSPCTALLPSDGTSDRPSPAMYSALRPPIDRPNSSPAKLPRQNLQRVGSEPQERYISLKESQAEREEQMRIQSTSSPLRNRKRMHEESDDGFDQVDTQLRRRRRQKAIELEAHRQFEKVTAKSRPDSRNAIRGGGTRKKGRQDTRSFSVTPQAPKGTVIISDDLQPDELDGNGSEDETEREEDVDTPDTDLPDELGDDNKENMDARRVQVPMTSSRTPRKAYAIPSPHSSPIRQRLKPAPVSDDVDELAGDGHDTAMGAPHAEKAQTVAIADSQTSELPSKQGKTTAMSKGHASEPKSSLDSRLIVPQSQIQPLPNTSQIDSQMARRILNGSSQLDSIPNTSSQTRSSPNLRRQSSPPHRISPRKAAVHSGNPYSEDPGLPSQLRSSSPRMPGKRQKISVQEDLPSSPPDVQRHVTKQKVAVRHEEKESNKLSLATETGSSSARRSRNHASTEPDQTPLHGTNTLGSTVPETCSALRLTAAVRGSPQPRDSSKLNSLATMDNSGSPFKTIRTQGPSASSTLFGTAQTHLSPPIPRPQLLRRSSEPHESPKKPNSRLARTFGDIAADPSPPDELAMEDVDIGLLTTEDVEFQAAMEGSSPVNPTRKRRRVYNGRAIHVVEHRSSSIAVAPTSSPAVSASITEEAQAPFTEMEITSVTRADTAKPAPAKDAKERKGVAARLVEKADVKSTSQARQNSRPSHKAQTPDKKAKEHASNHSEDEIASEAQTTSDADPAGASSEAKQKTPALPAQDNIVAPNRVFAYFNGSYAGYYPATCVAIVGGDEQKYRVRFDDGTFDTVNAASVKKLQLRPGDSVKVDETGARGHNYVVVGLSDKQPSLTEAASSTPNRRGRPSNAVKFPQTDMFGYTKVMVRAKHHQSDAPDNSGQTEGIVPLAKVYLTTTLWKSLKARPFTFHSTLPPPISGLQTPSDWPSTPSTPSSRSRRVKTITKSGSSAFSLGTIPRNTSSIFDNVVFCITNIEKAGIRRETEHTIRSNGGHLLENGFEELFHIPDIASATPSKANPTDDDTDSEPPFQLKQAFTTRGFTCLIADKHCRKQNFLQALALGIPCLATRWVRDCISKKSIIPWEPYLLPSGDSTFLNAVRSRHLPSFAPESVTLPEIIATRPDFLAGASVLLVMGKGKEEQMMRAYPFIAYALGASRVVRATDFERARRVLEGGDVKWVCYHEGEKAVGGLGRRGVEGVLFGGGGGGRGNGGGRGKKRKSRGMEEEMGERKTKIVVTETVVQSLILGRLVEEE